MATALVHPALPPLLIASMYHITGTIFRSPIVGKNPVSIAEGKTIAGQCVLTYRYFFMKPLEFANIMLFIDRFAFIFGRHSRLDAESF